MYLSQVGARIAASDKTNFLAAAGALATNKFIVGADSVIGAEDISLQGETIVKGVNTLGTSTAFKIYDGDTIPNTLWDFRNNGDLYVGGVQGFSGTGSYTSFTISNGVITSAS